MKYKTRIVKVPPVHSEPLSLPGQKIVHVLHSSVADGTAQLLVLVEMDDT